MKNLILDIDLSCSEWRVRLLREQHERKIHFFAPSRKKLVGAVPAKSVARNGEQRFRRKQASTHDVEIMSACLILARVLS